MREYKLSFYSLGQSANIIFTWFNDKQMKSNENMCHVLSNTEVALQLLRVLLKSITANAKKC